MADLVKAERPGTDYVLRSVAANGVDHLFLVPGGLVDPFMPALARVPELTPVVAAHEAGAAFMADGYARRSGNYGACLCIGGPGVTNTVTALSAAFTDQSPVLVLSGEVANFMQGQGVFQDASAGTFNDSRILSTVTAESYSVPDIRLLPFRLQGAIRRMMDGTRVPVHLSIPRDLQTGMIDAEPEAIAIDELQSENLDAAAASRLWTMLAGANTAPRVAIYIGGGAITDIAARDLIAAAERFQIPVATTELSKGVIPEDHPLSLGVFGYAGTQHATKAVIGAPPIDLLIVIGAIMNMRNSLNWSDKLNPRLGLLSVNSSNREVGFGSQTEHFVRGGGGAFARWLLAASDAEAKPLLAGISERKAWVDNIRKGPRYYDLDNTGSAQTPIYPARMIADVRRTMPRNTTAVVDSGAHRAFAVHYWDSYGPRTFLTAAGLGPMGWAIGAGIGAKAAAPDAPVVVFTGDGCMRMHGMEVQSAVRAGLPVIYVVSNNQALGNVWLRMRQLGPLPMHLTEAPDQDWAEFARALGATGITVRDAAAIVPALEQALAANTTCVIDVKTERAASTPIEPYAAARNNWSYHE